MQAVFRDRNEPTAEASFAAIFERSKLGMAIAAMIKMIATTIKSSINEKPFCLFRINSPSRFEVRTGIRSIRSASMIPILTGASFRVYFHGTSGGTYVELVIFRQAP